MDRVTIMRDGQYIMDSDFKDLTMDKIIANMVGREIKEQFPDLIPLGFNNFETDGTSSLGDKLQDFLGTPIVNDDNTFYDRDMDEDYLSWIKTLNQAYKNGCISDDSFTDDNTAWQEKESIGKYACIMMEGTPQQAGFLTNVCNIQSRCGIYRN